MQFHIGGGDGGAVCAHRRRWRCLRAIAHARSPSRISARCSRISRGSPRASHQFILIASPFGTIHAATFSLPRPIGTAHPASAALCAGEFRSARHHRLDRRGIARRPKRAAAIPHRQPQATSATRCLRAPARRCRRCRRRCRSSRCRRRKPMPRSSRTRRSAVSIPIRNTNSPPSPTSRRSCRDAARRPCADQSGRRGAAESTNAARIYFGAEPLVGEREALRALGARRGAGGNRSPPPAIPTSSSRRRSRRSADVGHGRRDHRQQRRGHRRRPAAEIAGRAAGAQPARRAPRRKSVSPTRSISKRAAKRCAGRSRSRRW